MGLEEDYKSALISEQSELSRNKIILSQDQRNTLEKDLEDAIEFIWSCYKKNN